MAGNSKKVCLLISHPDFQKPGMAGVQAAQAYGAQLLQGATDILEEAQKHGGHVDRRELMAYLEGFRYFVKTIPESEL